MNSGGSPGVFRIFGQGLAGDIAWLLAFALIGVLAWVSRPKDLSFRGLEEAGFTSGKGLTLIAMLLWLIPGLLYFSFTSGFWHDYYIATIAPPIAGLVGIGAAGLYRSYGTGGWKGWLLVVAVLVTGLLETLFLSYDADWAGPLVPLVLMATLICTGLLALMLVRKTPVLANHRVPIIAAAVGILFVAPFVWSCTPIMTGNGGNIPSAGPQGSHGGFGGGMTGGSGMAGAALVSGMPGAGGTGISGTDIPGSLRDRTGRDGSYGPGNSTRLSDRTATVQAGSGTGISGTDAAGGPPSGQTGLSAAGTTAGGPAGSGMTGAGGIPGNRTSGISAMSGGPQGMGGGDASTGRLAEYLLAHTANETWILAVPSSQAGANLIIETGKAVMCLGGFTGSDQVLNVTTIQDYIRDGKVRFFQTGGSGGGGGTGGGNSEIFSWVETHCTAVDLTGENEAFQNVTGSAGTGLQSSGSLYDCAGAAGSG